MSLLVTLLGKCLLPATNILRPAKIKPAIHKEIPEKHHTNGHKLRNVEVEQLKVIVQKPDDGIIDEESRCSNGGEQEELFQHIRVGAFKGPFPVDDVIGGCGKCEAQGIGGVFVDTDDFLEENSSGIVDHHPRKAYNAEF